MVFTRRKYSGAVSLVVEYTPWGYCEWRRGRSGQHTRKRPRPELFGKSARRAAVLWAHCALVPKIRRAHPVRTSIFRPRCAAVRRSRLLLHSETLFMIYRDRLLSRQRENNDKFLASSARRLSARGASLCIYEIRTLTCRGLTAK